MAILQFWLAALLFAAPQPAAAQEENTFTVYIDASNDESIAVTYCVMWADGSYQYYPASYDTKVQIAGKEYFTDVVTLDEGPYYWIYLYGIDSEEGGVWLTLVDNGVYSLTEYLGTMEDIDIPSESSMQKPVFSPESCTFSRSIEVSISQADGYDIYYTTDGTDPGIDNGTLYSGPLTFTETTVLKAVAINADGETSNVARATYSNSFHQIGEGYNPANPGDPEAPELTKKYTLCAAMDPSGAGHTNFSKQTLSPGQSCYLYAYLNDSSYKFVNWTCDGQVVSTSRSFEYVMPERNVTLIANAVFDPTSPDNPAQPVLSHPVTFTVTPASGGRFNYSNTSLKEGETCTVYFSPNTGYNLVEWYKDGEPTGVTSTTFTFTMGEKPVSIEVRTVYNPENPSNPNANSWNEQTGVLIIDDFEQGNLYYAITNKVNYNTNNVRSLIVKGLTYTDDLNQCQYLSNLESADYTRTNLSTASYFRHDLLTKLYLPESLSSLSSSAFYSCPVLKHLSVYAKVPPTATASSFSGIDTQNCVLHVPADVINLYEEAEGWKEFATILPLMEELHALQVNLPSDCTDGRYKGYRLELVNLVSGVRQKYVVTDRPFYTFLGMQEAEQYMVLMTSSTGLSVGRIDNVVIPDADSEVTFGSLKSVTEAKASVMLPDGTDITGNAVIEWYESQADGSLTYLLKGAQLGDVPMGQKLVCRASLPQSLGMTYQIPSSKSLTVDEDNASVRFDLTPLKNVTVSGKVTSTVGEPIAGATVSVNGKVNGQWDLNYSAQTDKSGEWTLTTPELTSATVSASAPDYLKKTADAGNLTLDQNVVEDLALKSVIGSKIVTSFTFTKAVADGSDAAATEYLPDSDDLSFAVYNETKGRQQTELSYRYPYLTVIDETVDEGDELRITLSSLGNKFATAETTCRVESGAKGTALFAVTEPGSISSVIEMTDNAAVQALLYSADGSLAAKSEFTEAQAAFSKLAAGDYTLVAVGKSPMLNGLQRLPLLQEYGLTEGTDYVKADVKVMDGKIASVVFSNVPLFDENRFSFFTQASLFTSLKASVNAGSYLTLKSAFDFKGMYKSGISDVRLIVDLPENLPLMTGSVMLGRNLYNYEYADNRLTVDFNTNPYTETVKFVTVPVSSGESSVTASVAFNYNGQPYVQPLGQALCTVKNLDLNVPYSINDPSFAVSGSGYPRSRVDVYDANTLLGQTVVNANGSWNTTCTLVNPLNLSEHPIRAEITTPDGYVLNTDSEPLLYDITFIKPKKVEMLHYYSKVTFDYEHPYANSNYYTFVPGYNFTFLAYFDTPDTNELSDVVINVKTTQGRYIGLTATYDASKDCWVASGTFNSMELPVNVALKYSSDYKALADARVFSEGNTGFDTLQADNKAQYDSIQQLNEDAAAAQLAADQLAATLEALNPRLEDEATEDEATAEIWQALGLSPMEDPTLPDYSSMDYDELEQAYEEAMANADRLLDEEIPGAGRQYGEYEDLVLESDAMFDMEASLASMLEEDLTVDTPDGPVSVKKLPLTVDISTLDEEEIIRMATTDGLEVVIWQPGDSNTYILDPANNVMWQVTDGRISQLRQLSAKDMLDKLWKAYTDIQNFLGVIFSFVGDAADAVKADIARLTSQMDQISGDINDLIANSAACEMKARDVERQIRELESQELLDLRSDAAAHDKLRQLRERRKNLLNEIERNSNLKGRYQARINGLKSKHLLKVALVGQIMDVYELIDDVVVISQMVYGGWCDISKWNRFIDSILPCDNDQANANALKSNSENARNEYGGKYVGAVAIVGFSTVISATMMTNKVAAVFKFVAPFLTSFLKDCSKSLFQETLADSRVDYRQKVNLRNALKCHKDNPPYHDPADDTDYEDPNNPKKRRHRNPFDPDGNGWDSGNPDTRFGIDPSGFVYEGVESNRVEGVQASVYYKEERENMWGEPELVVELWNAEEYAQRNPLFTDEQGLYAWDVPSGLWQVKFEKEGYVTTYSDWLPVPPPQLEVNIGITQNSQPEVVEVHAYEEGVEITFDKYMQPSSLNPQTVYVTANGERVAGNLEFVNLEESNGQEYASIVRFVPEESLTMATGTVQLMVLREVRSYAGIPMVANYSQELDIEKEVKEIKAEADNMQVLYGAERKVIVSALPFDAAAGRTLRVKSSSADIVTFDNESYVLNDEGQAEITVRGMLPGNVTLTFTLDETAASGECVVNVVNTLFEMEAPTSSRISGTQVYRGTKVELRSALADAVIYYTLDGSCPCDADGSRMKYVNPIVVNGDVDILAMAVAPTKEESEVAEFVYSLKRSDVDFNLADGWNWISHNLETPVPVSVFDDKKNVERVLSQRKEAIRDPQYGLVGNLTEMVAEESYKVYANEVATTERVNDLSRNPATPISVKKGWTWLGYPVDQTMSLEEAFQPTQMTADDLLVGQGGFAQYDGSKWVGTLDVLKPGTGYMLQSVDDKNVVFNTSIVSNAASTLLQSPIQKTPWAVDIRKYPNIMCMVASLVDKDGFAYPDGEWHLGAFVDGECRGVGKYVDGMVLMSVYGRNGEQVRLHAMRNGTADERMLAESWQLSETLIGNVSEPIELMVSEQSGLVDRGADRHQVYLENGELHIGGDLSAISRLSVINAEGINVLKLAKVTDGVISLAGLPTGVYTVVIEEANHWYYHKLMVK